MMFENIELDEYILEHNVPSESIPKLLLSLLEEKNSAEFSRILQHHPFDVNYFYGSPYNGTLLHIACRSIGNHEIVKILLEYGAEINQVNKIRGSAPIHEAVEFADIETLDILLRNKNCDVNLLDIHKCTPAMKADALRRGDKLKILLNDGRISLATTDKKPASHLLSKIEKYELTEFLPDTSTEHAFDSTWSTDELKLLSYFKDNLLQEFQLLLATAIRGSVNLDRIYHEVLDMACRTKGKSEFISELIQKGALFNNPNAGCLGKTHVHLAVQYSDPQTLEIIVAGDICNVNASDRYGNTALHIAVKRNNAHAIHILLKHPHIDINKFDQRRHTPLHLALSLNRKQIIRQLLKHSDIDLDAPTDLQGISCRQIISKKYPHLRIECIENTPNDPISRGLFSLLYKQQTKLFMHLAEFHVSVLLTGNDGFFTFLQLACDSGLTEVVDKLLAWDMDPNQCCLNNHQTPIMIAAEKGYHEIVRKLLDDPLISLDPIDQETVLHSLFRGMLAAQDDTNEAVENNDDSECDHRKCLVYILDAIPRTRLEVNFGDRQGNTALHYAAKLNDDLITLLLLNAGSNVCIKNHAGDTALKSINAAVLERYLDSCVSTNEESSTHVNHQIILNCRIFKPPESQYQISEVEPLLVLNDTPELGCLLKHPVLTAFLHIKWLRTKIFYYLNVVFYSTFCLVLGLYVFYRFREDHSGDTKSITNQSVSPTSNPAMVPSTSVDIFKYILQFITAILCVILALRECFQMYVDFRRYFKSAENWLELSLIVVTSSLLTWHFKRDQCHQMAAVAIFASAFELILLIGRHPSLSTNTEIFKTVTLNFLRFLRCYSILILAFAVCSYILHRSEVLAIHSNVLSVHNNESAAHSNESAAYSNVSATLHSRNPLDEFGTIAVQSFVRLIEPAKDYELGDQVNFKHAFYALNVFFITLVLSCLLSGLAVNDIHKIKKNAKLLGIVSRMRCIWYVDFLSTIDLNPIICLAKQFAYFRWCRCGNRWHCPLPHDLKQPNRPSYYKILPDRIRLFPYKLPDCMIRILPNDNMAILLVDVSTEASGKSYPLLKYSAWKMDDEIANSARKILEKRKSPDTFEIKSKDQSIYAAIKELRHSRSQCTKLMPGIDSESGAHDPYAQPGRIRSNNAINIASLF